MRPTADPVTLQATIATTPEEAARVFPGDYWLSLMAPPDESLFPGTGDDGNGMGTRMLSQAHWLDSLKSDCNFCHQLGSRQTRTVDHVFEAKPELTTHKEAWEWRLGTGVRGNQMYNVLRIQGMDASLEVYADWTERIAAGELPPPPPRPQGIERNLVLTLWDVGSDKTFMHDLVSTDKNNPRVNAGGPVYAASSGHGQLVVMDPVQNVSYARSIPTREPRSVVPSRFPPPMRPSFFWGDEHIWGNPPYHPVDTLVFDETGDEQQAVGWCPLVVDTNGDGEITKPWNVAVASAGGYTYRVDAVRAEEDGPRREMSIPPPSPTPGTTRRSPTVSTRSFRARSTTRCGAPPRPIRATSSA